MLYMPRKTARINMRLTQVMMARIRAYCTHTSQSITNVITSAIDGYLRRRDY